MSRLGILLSMGLLLGVEGCREAPGDRGVEDTMKESAQGEGSRMNRLGRETSPYLLQHSRNPVAWYPWGKEALEKARNEGKPIFLSIGYSACHWCHVMERESFENQTIAGILNQHFVSIKVDREERPEVDEIYMRAVQMLTGRGGWPLSVFLTPDLQPFYGGTYFPPEDRYGIPGFKTVLTQISEAWVQRRGEVQGTAERLTEMLQSVPRASEANGDLDRSVLTKACERLSMSFDARWGGFGRAPKFPQAGSIALLLRQYRNTGDASYLTMATVTLDRMAYGGMYDQLGGGFHRYSVDTQWLVPHFEKMLYDNAQLAAVYLEAYQVTGKPLYREVVLETLDYVLREMTDKAGGFHSSEDADSEGEEGLFYIWRPEEIKALLGEDDAGLLAAYYGVTEVGNFEHQNILHVPEAPEAFVKRHKLSESEWRARLAGMHKRLLEARNRRIRPGKDDKVLLSWNGMMISSLCRAYQVLGQDRYRAAALHAGQFMTSTMIRDGELLHTYRGGVAKLPGNLNDYAHAAVAMLDLYETTFDVQWLRQADALAAKMIELFSDKESPGFYYTSVRHQNLVSRSKTFWDGSVPSGNAVAAMALLRMAKLTGKTAYHDLAIGTVEEAVSVMRDQFGAFSHMLVAADFSLSGSREIVVVGDDGSEGVVRLLEAVRRPFFPNKVVAYLDPALKGPTEAIPLFQGRGLVEGRAAVYICEDFTCKKPMTDVREVGSFLGLSVRSVE